MQPYILWPLAFLAAVGTVTHAFLVIWALRKVIRLIESHLANVSIIAGGLQGDHKSMHENLSTLKNDHKTIVRMLLDNQAMIASMHGPPLSHGIIGSDLVLTVEEVPDGQD